MSDSESESDDEAPLPPGGAQTVQEAATDCPFCLSHAPACDMKIHPCGHLVHFQCILQAAQHYVVAQQQHEGIPQAGNTAFRCPMCRAPIFQFYSLDNGQWTEDYG
jgi:hypothetical protein